MGTFKALGQALLVLFIVTIIGQIRIQGVSLEMRYHRAVNSAKFQKVFWVAARPVTWTGEKVEDLYQDYKEKKDRAAPSAAR